MMNKLIVSILLIAIVVAGCSGSKQYQEFGNKSEGGLKENSTLQNNTLDHHMELEHNNSVERDESFIYPNSHKIELPQEAVSYLMLDSEYSSYMSSDQIDKVYSWYQEIGPDSSFDFHGMKIMKFNRGEDSVLVIIQTPPDVDMTIIIVARADWGEVSNYSLGQEHTEEEQEGYQYIPPFYSSKELGEGNITFTQSPIEIKYISRIEPLGRLNAPTGHPIPTDHGGFVLTNPSKKYDLVMPADGVLVEVDGEKEYRLIIAHTSTFSTVFDHVTELSPDIVESLEGAKRMNSSYILYLPLKAGETIGKVGGGSSAGFDWGVYDREITNYFVNPERYDERFIHAVHFINYLTDDLKSEYYAKSDALPGNVSYDINGRLVGNWFYSGSSEWEDQLSFSYNYLDHSKIEIAIGGHLSQPANYFVDGNSPDPADVKVGERVIYHLYPNPEISEDRPRITLLVELINESAIKIESFNGWVDEEFDNNALIYYR